MNVQAIIPAGGQGKRFGARKQFQSLNGREILFHTVDIFERSPSISAICLVIPEEEIKKTRAKSASYHFKKVRWIVAGGKERQESVSKGFAALPSSDFVVVHDGVRPLLNPKDLERVIQSATHDDACTLGTPIKETIKRVDSNQWILETVDRRTLWNIQTPQVFRYSLLKRAIEAAERDHFLGTDEAMLVERLGVKVRVIEGSETNIKITTPDDLKIAAALLTQGVSS